MKTRSKLNKEPNALELFGVRECSFLPRHFEKTTVEVSYTGSKKLIEWISYNTRGRYFIGEQKGQFNKWTVGFENPKDMSFFLLAYK